MPASNIPRSSYNKGHLGMSKAEHLTVSAKQHSEILL